MVASGCVASRGYRTSLTVSFTHLVCPLFRLPCSSCSCSRPSLPSLPSVLHPPHLPRLGRVQRFRLLPGPSGGRCAARIRRASAARVPVRAPLATWQLQSSFFESSKLPYFLGVALRSTPSAVLPSTVRAAPDSGVERIAQCDTGIRCLAARRSVSPGPNAQVGAEDRERLKCCLGVA